MRKLLLILEKFFPLLKNTTMPALIFAVSLLSFYAFDPFDSDTLKNLHQIFLIATITSFLLLFYFNNNKPVFLLLINTLGYLIISYLKKETTADLTQQPLFINLSIILPLNMLIFFYLPERKIFHRYNVYILLIVLAEFSLIENLSRLGIILDPFSVLNEISHGLPLLSCLLYALCLISLFITISINGYILETSLFFYSFEIALGIIYAPTYSGLIIFNTSAAITILLGIGEHLHNIKYHDLLTGLSNRNTFLKQENTFPLKYSLAIILIDDYERLSKIFGKGSINALVLMIKEQMETVETEAQIYRFAPDEFIVLYRGLGLKDAFNHTEKIRRAIACTKFNLRGYTKPINLTISGSVAEKKRSDVHAADVLLRADKALQKAYRFTQNITSQA